MHPNPSSSPRAEWFFEVSTLFQQAACEEAFTGDLEGALLRIVPKLPLPTHRTEVLALAGLILESVVRSRMESPQAISELIQRLMPTARPGKGLTNAQRAADYMAGRSEEQLRLTRMARMLGCEETRLRREFKAEYGTSLREYHQRLRVRRALVLIAAGPSKIAPIIRATGYTTESHFYRAVRRLTGRTPAALAGEPHDVLSRLANELLPPRRPTMS